MQNIDLLKEKTVLPEIVLPTPYFDVVEQFTLAMHNRDKKALEFLISKKQTSMNLKDKKSFIKNYLSYCNFLEKKYGEIYVQSYKGACADKKCNFESRGVSFSIHSLRMNKQLWRFNIIVDFDADNCIELEQCFDFKLTKTEV